MANSPTKTKGPSVVPCQSSVGDLLERIDQAVHAHPHLYGHDVFCNHQQGTVTLHGKVRTFFQKQMAQEALRKLEGVEKIINLLEVDWSDSSRLTQHVEI